MPARRRGRVNRHAGVTRPTLLILALAGTFFDARAAVDLTTLSMEQLMDLRVVGASKYEQKQSEVAAAVSIISREEIRTFGWRTIDQALATLPGIYTTYDRQYVYLGARGFGLPGDFNTRILVTINGNRANDALYDAGPLARQMPLDLDLVERIEFVPGPGGAVYGQNAMLGVVNIVTRTGESLGGTELAAGLQQPQSLREGRASWGRRFDNGLDLLVSASGLRARGEDRHFDYGASGVSGVASGLDGARDRELFVRAGYGSWSFDLVQGDFRKDDPTGAYRSDPLVAGQYEGDRYLLSQLQYQGQALDGALDLHARLFAGQERYTSQLSYGAPFQFPSTGEWRGLELRSLYTGVASHKLMVGIEAQDNTKIEQRILDLSNPANDIVIAGAGSRIGTYMQDEWRLSAVLTATIGVRVDHDNGSGTRSSPRVGAIWHPLPTSSVKMLYGRAHRDPNAYERNYDDGFAQIANPALKGERIDTLELVADHRVGENLSLRASAYEWTMHDLVTLGVEPVSGIAQYQSGGAVKARGVELSADRTWSWGGRLRANVSMQQARQSDARRLLNSPRALARVNVWAPLSSWGVRLGYEWQYDGARRTLDGSDAGGYALSHLYLSTDQWVRGLSLGLGVRNVFDKRYAHPGADTNWQNTLEQDGRSVRLEARYRF